MRLAVRMLAVFALGSAAFSAYGETLTETISANYMGVNGPEETSGGIRFDPALGTVNSITETLTGQIVFLATSSAGNYRLNTENGINVTYTTSQMLNVSYSIPYLDEFTGPSYHIEALDLSVKDGSVSSVGPVKESYVFDYTPAAVTPEPSTLILMGTGLVGGLAALRRRVRG